MEHLRFMVRGGRGNQHQVTFEKDGAELRAFCTCRAGAEGIYCKHRFALMHGSIDDLLSKNAMDLKRLWAWMAGTELEAAYLRKIKADMAFERSKAESDKTERIAATRNLARVMYGRGRKAA